MRWFGRRATPEKQVDAVVKIATNLYLHTIPEAHDAPATLQFTLPDSRYRYLLFCLGAAATAVLVYDEKKEVQPDSLLKGCLQFATWAVTHNPQDYLSDLSTGAGAAASASAYLMEFLKRWAQWPTLEKEGKSRESNNLLCSMIRTTESPLPATKEDMARIGKLALQIECQMPAMRGAFLELTTG